MGLHWALRFGCVAWEDGVSPGRALGRHLSPSLGVLFPPLHPFPMAFTPYRNLENVQTDKTPGFIPEVLALLRICASKVSIAIVTTPIPSAGRADMGAG